MFGEFADRPQDLAGLAAAIRESAATDTRLPAQPEEDEEGVAEGRLLFRQHRTRERSRKLAAKKKAAVLAAEGRLTCEVCGLDPATRYGDAGDAVLECHHRRPLADSGPRQTRISDLALLCASCHRAIHRVRPWRTVEEFSTLVAP